MTAPPAEDTRDIASAAAVLRGYVVRRAQVDADRDRAIGMLYRAGWTDRALADVVGCNHVTMQRWRTEAGIAGRPRGALCKLQPETIAAIRYLAARGTSMTSIALKLGIHRSTVTAYAAPDEVAKAAGTIAGGRPKSVTPEPTHRRILDLARRGLNDAAIGREVFVSRHTVKRLREAAQIPAGTLKTSRDDPPKPVPRFEDDPRAVRDVGGPFRGRAQGGWGRASSIAGLG